MNIKPLRTSDDGKPSGFTQLHEKLPGPYNPHGKHALIAITRDKTVRLWYQKHDASFHEELAYLSPSSATSQATVSHATWAFTKGMWNMLQ